MRGFLIILAFFAAVLFMMPFVVSIVMFFLLFAAVLMLLARIGLIPGMTYRRYTYTTSSKTSRRPPGRPRPETFRFDDGEAPRENDDGWSQSEQEGETITLPETALKKDDEESSSSP